MGHADLSNGDGHIHLNSHEGIWLGHADLTKGEWHREIARLDRSSLEDPKGLDWVMFSVAGTILPPKDPKANPCPIQICHRPFDRTADRKIRSVIPHFFGDSYKIGLVGAQSVAPTAQSVVPISRSADLERIECGSVEVRVCIHRGSRADPREGVWFYRAFLCFFVFGNSKLFCEELHFLNTPKVPLDAP